ncbi:MAG: hypothetical protein IPO29_18180 [Anaerolineae bacterium]|nr:hypothetical protein [Anaerolineae bacterium]
MVRSPVVTPADSAERNVIFGVAVAVAVVVAVDVGVGVGVSVGVGAGAGVFVAVSVGVGVRVTVPVDVGVPEGVAEGVGVPVAVADAVAVAVGVGDAVGVGLCSTRIKPANRTPAISAPYATSPALSNVTVNASPDSNVAEKTEWVVSTDDARANPEDAWAEIAGR